MLRFSTFSSGSKGNCYLLEDGKTKLLIECGIPWKEIQKNLDFNLKQIQGVLLSHSHQDHSKAASDVMKAGLDLYTITETAELLNLNGHRLNVIPLLKQFQIGSFTILPFDTQHDVPNSGYLIYSNYTKEKFLFATDTYYIKYKFNQLTHVAIECNYSKEILERNISAGKVSDFLKKRLLSSHFSLENVKKFFLANDITKLREIFLLHLSDGNSNAKNFKTEIEKLTGVPVTVC